MAKSADTLNLYFNGQIKTHSLYTSNDDFLLPQVPLVIDNVKGVLYPYKEDVTGSIFVNYNDKRYMLMENHKVPIPTDWSSYDTYSGYAYDIAAGNGIMMLVGSFKTSTTAWEIRCFTSTYGLNFEQKSKPISGTSSTGGFNNSIIEYFNGYFYLSDGTRLRKSADGVTWTDVSSSESGLTYVYYMEKSRWNPDVLYFLGEYNSYLTLSAIQKNSMTPVRTSIIKIVPTDGLSISGIYFFRNFLYTKFTVQTPTNSVSYFYCYDISNPKSPSYKGTPSGLPSGIVHVFEYENKLYIYGSGQDNNKVSTNGTSFSNSSLPFNLSYLTMGPITAQGEDLGRRLSVYTVETSRNEDKFDFYAFDNNVNSAHINNTPILITKGSTGLKKLLAISSLQDGGGAYLGLYSAGTSSAILYFAEYP